MQVFTKEIKGAKYTVYYTFNRQFGSGNDYHVNIVKSSYKKLENFDFRNILSNWDLKRIIENELCMPVV
jgi:hypothetical protein